MTRRWNGAKTNCFSATLPGALAERLVPAPEYELFQGLTGQEIAVIVPRFKHRRFSTQRNHRQRRR